MTRAVALGVAALLYALPGQAQDVVSDAPLASPRSGGVSFKLGGYKPAIDEEAGLNGAPFRDTFGEDASLLLFEVQVERFFYQGIGTAGIAFSGGYAEKYADTLNTEGEVAPEKTALKIIPLQLSAIYKFDYAAFKWGIPIVPYGQLGLIYMPWWVNKGEETQEINGVRASGGKWGYGLTGGFAFMLDVLEPRLARDFDTDLGVNHSYVFAEYNHRVVNNFGGEGLNLSSGFWMFGLALDY
jgi:hypothetical protein